MLSHTLLKGGHEAVRAKDGGVHSHWDDVQGGHDFVQKVENT